MKMVFQFLTLFIVVFAAGCSKEQTAALEDGTLELTLHNCSDNTKTGSGNTADNGKICFTNFINESRCATGATCAWEGYAACEFSININGQEKRFTLSTLKRTGFPLSNDTTINNTKISLVDVLPHPDLNNPQPTGPQKAILKIGQ